MELIFPNKLTMTIVLTDLYFTSFTGILKNALHKITFFLGRIKNKNILQVNSLKKTCIKKKLQIKIAFGTIRSEFNSNCIFLLGVASGNSVQSGIPVKHRKQGPNQSEI
jgi:hypothetical protein